MKKPNRLQIHLFPISAAAAIMRASWHSFSATDALWNRTTSTAMSGVIPFPLMLPATAIQAARCN